MSSQGAGLEILERLAEWSTEEIESNLDQILQELLSHLTGEDKGHVLQAVYALLVTCLPCLPIDKAEESLLHHAMPAAQQLFHESLEGVKLRLEEKSQSDLEEITETLSSLLQVCIELLKCMECVLQYIESQGNVSISSVPNVPKTIAVLMSQTFKHCKDSETLYGEVFIDVADVLGAVFRQCHQVQCRFFATFTTNITFECSVETDIVHLIDILQVLSEVGEYVMSLDIKTMAEQWKGYTKILQLHLLPLRDRLNIAYPLNYLSAEIRNNLEQLTCQVSQKDARSITRLIKTTSFILKIVVKLCEQFGSGNACLGDCYSSICQLLLSLHKHSPPLLLVKNMDRSIVDEIERNLTIAAEPLLSHVICEEGFRKEFFRRLREVSSVHNDCLPLLLLIPSVMKKLGSFSHEDKALWLGDTEKNNIVGCLLGILKYSHLELSREICIPAAVKSGEMPRNIELYETLCSHCAGFVLTFSAHQFQIAEVMLADSLLEPYIWPAIFAGDVWCICARAGNSELVLDQVLYFADIASSFEPTSLTERIECQIVSQFIHRLCSFLGTKGKQILAEKFPPSDHPLMWKVFGLQCFPKEMKDSISEVLITNSAAHIENFLDSNTSTILFEKMISSLYGLSAVLECFTARKSSIDSETHKIICKVLPLWQYTCQGYSSSSNCVSGPKWPSKLLGILCKCFGNLVQVMCNNEILLVLNQLNDIVNSCSSSVKLSIMNILHGLATKTLEPTADQGLVCTKISYLFSNFLEDSNLLVREAALDTFEYFAHFTTHESVVAEAVGGNMFIQDIVTKFLQKEAPTVKYGEKILDRQEYLIFQGKISLKHKCEIKNQPALSPQSPEQPAKKLRLDFDSSSDLSKFLADDLLTDFVGKDIDETISRIVKDSQYVISQCSFDSLPSSLKSDLKKAVFDLKNFMDL